MLASQRVWQGVEFVLLGLVVSLLVLGGRLVVQTAVVRVPATDATVLPTPAAVQPLAAYAVIERRNIFGRSDEAATAGPTVILRGVGVHVGSMRAAIEDPTTHAQRLVSV